MRTLRQVNIKNRPHYFFNDTINITNFDPSLLDIGKISFKSTDDIIFHIEYITMKSLDSKNIDSANSLYLIFNYADGHIEKSEEDTYLIFASTDKNKEVLERYTELWDEIKNQIETISGNKPIKCGKNLMKIRFELDYDLPLGKILSIPVCIIAVGSVFR